MYVSHITVTVYFVPILLLLHVTEIWMRKYQEIVLVTKFFFCSQWCRHSVWTSVCKCDVKLSTAEAQIENGNFKNFKNFGKSQILAYFKNGFLKLIQIHHYTVFLCFKCNLYLCLHSVCVCALIMTANSPSRCWH